MFVLTGLTAVFRHSRNPLTAQLFATLDISLSADTLMMPHQSPYRGVTLGIMMVEGAFVSRLGLLLFLDSVSLDGDAPPALQRGILQQLENQHLPFRWPNKAVVCICRLAHMDVLSFYVLAEWV